MSRTTIVCTIGPVTCNPDSLLKLKDAGMSVARLNGSHADIAWHTKAISMIKETLPDTPILLDIPGRKIRTAQLTVEPVFKVGETIVLTTEPDHDGREKISVSYGNLHNDLSVGDIVIADDGTLRFSVIDITGRDITCRAEVNGQLKSRKGINVPYVKLQMEEVTERDRQMIQFAKEMTVDFIGISFVESASHVRAIRDVIGSYSPRIVSKVENRGGLANVKEIAEASDVLMIDRGDLSVETELEEVALNQKRIIETARQYSKPVIVATEMLHSMIDHRFPTKAEISDITNAVLDGCAATMLSGETAVGEFWVQAVETMRGVADRANGYRHEKIIESSYSRSVPDAIEDAIALICKELPITKIVAITISGFAAQRMSARRPAQQILCVSNDPMTARAANLLPGTKGVYVEAEFRRRSTDHIPVCLEALYRGGHIVPEDMILVTALGYPKSGNRMNLIQTHVVADLADALEW